MRALAAVLLLAWSCAPSPSSIPGDAANALASIHGAELRAHMSFLADDLLEGRDTGTRGYRIAARYVAAELEAMGLEAAGDDGSFFQMVPASTRHTRRARELANDRGERTAKTTSHRGGLRSRRAVSRGRKPRARTACLRRLWRLGTDAQLGRLRRARCGEQSGHPIVGSTDPVPLDGTCLLFL